MLYLLSVVIDVFVFVGHNNKELNYLLRLSRQTLTKAW